MGSSNGAARHTLIVTYLTEALIRHTWAQSRTIIGEQARNTSGKYSNLQGDSPMTLVYQSSWELAQVVLPPWTDCASSITGMIIAPGEDVDHCRLPRMTTVSSTSFEIRGSQPGLPMELETRNGDKGRKGVDRRWACLLGRESSRFKGARHKCYGNKFYVINIAQAHAIS